MHLQVPLAGQPSLTYDNSYQKIIAIEVFIGQILQRRRFKKHINDSMQDDMLSPNNKGKKDVPMELESILQTKKEIGEKETPKTDITLTSPIDQVVCTKDYTCTCEKCQNEFGGLPILLQGIEIKTMEQRLETQPSTSAGLPHKQTENKLPKKCLTCQYCYKSFHHKGDYNKHLRKHTKEKPFKCTMCDRKFSHTSNLQRHFRLHSGLKPFICKTCGKTFSRKDKLHSHQNSRLCQKRATSSN